ncbi:hypothetical protein F5J12DRAFT_821775 [Pisolithus orientalis]|uniref:uncharacterized protein n=1 Tax=Pisolithus orientalis TaxID=936130 RepID=UPI002224284B|nr:uncharacterized protein F5J12DRAFT_821775 [Pisolithus orientalis]KAI6010814.1 hypothetical protein F5J12DRAFT_821775 [Pisolithus orientalis]
MPTPQAPLSPGHFCHPSTLCNFTLILDGQFMSLGKISDSDAAITLSCTGLEMTLLQHWLHAFNLHILASCLYSRFKKLGEITDLHNASSKARAALALTLEQSPDQLHVLCMLSHCLSESYRVQGEVADAEGEEAVALGEAALQLTLLDCPERPLVLCTLAKVVWYRSKQRSSMVDLERAIKLVQDALELSSPKCPLHPVYLGLLANCFYDKFRQEGILAKLDEAMTLSRTAPELTLPGHLYRPFCLNTLSVLSDLKEAVMLRQAVVELCPVGHPDSVALWNSLTLSIQDWFQKHDTSTELDNVITHGHLILDLCPWGYPDHTVAVESLSTCLRKRFRKQGTISDLDEGIALCKEAAELCPSDCPTRSSLLHELALCLSERSKRPNAVLEEAIAVEKAALVLHPPRHLRRAESLQTLTLFLRNWCRDTNGDLEEATLHGRVALGLCSPDHPTRPSCLHTLALCLCDRYQKQNMSANINEAVTLLRVALELRPQGHPDQPSMLHGLAQGTVANLDDAIALEQSALDLCLPGSPDYVISLSCLARFIQAKTRKQWVGMCPYLGPQVTFECLKMILNFKSSCQYEELLFCIRSAIHAHFHKSSLHDIEAGGDGLSKLQAFCTVILQQGYLWVDNIMELQEMIKLMFSWYWWSALTLVYLSDVAEPGSLCHSTWLRRSWTLLELLAPCTILFYMKDWSPYVGHKSSNHKTDLTFLYELEKATGIALCYLTDFHPGIDEAQLWLQWDMAYTLFGIFGLHLPIHYGESAEIALGCLLAEIILQSWDISILDWVGKPSSITSYPFLEKPTSWPLLKVAACKKYRSLSNLTLPQFYNQTLKLPCVVRRIKLVKLMQIQLARLKPLELTLLEMLKDGSEWLRVKLPYILENDAGYEQWLEQPFIALLIASFCHIVAYLVDFLAGEVTTLTVV